jgi:hypothetical protein
LATGQLIIAIKAANESISTSLLSYGIFQLFAISILLPAYFARALTDLIPTIVGTIWCLIFPWDKLIEQTESSRRQSAMFAQLQLEGKYIFRDGDIARVNRSGKEWMNNILWGEHTEEFEVCGARARFVHLRPERSDDSSTSTSSKRPILFLHGSRSWSFMWRKVCQLR